MKVCSACRVEQPLENFQRDRTRYDGRQAWCKACRSAHISRTYRLKKSGTYAMMLTEQRGLCPVCQEPMDEPCVDHDHRTGKVRALLHHRCNMLVGVVETSIADLLAAADYVERHRAA